MDYAHFVGLGIADADLSFVPSVHKSAGWETGIRTPIGRSRDCSPTIRRSPSVLLIYVSKTVIVNRSPEPAQKVPAKTHLAFKDEAGMRFRLPAAVTYCRISGMQAE